MTPTSNNLKAPQKYGVARAVSIAVGVGLLVYGMRRRSWLGRLAASAGTGLIARSVGTEGTLASAWAYIHDRFPALSQKALPTAR
jgi:uncharacterized membrane protein